MIKQCAYCKASMLHVDAETCSAVCRDMLSIRRNGMRNRSPGEVSIDMIGMRPVSAEQLRAAEIAMMPAMQNVFFDGEPVTPPAYFRTRTVSLDECREMFPDPAAPIKRPGKTGFVVRLLQRLGWLS